MMKRLVSGIFTSVLLLAFQAHAIKFSGVVLDEVGNGVPFAQISLGANSFKANKSGKFQLDIEEQTLYSLSFSKPGFYSIIHTFSIGEITTFSKTAEQQIPPITLVAKSKDRTMFAFGGDVMMGRRFHKPYFGNDILIKEQTIEQDTKAIVKHIKPYMALADFAVVNLETQIATTEPSSRASKSVTFYSPPETLGALSWAGIDYVTLGNNHTFDYLDSGLRSTLDFLDKSTLKYSGAGENESIAMSPYVASLANNKYAMLGYVGWEGSIEPTQTAASNKGGAAYGSMPNILKSVKASVNKGYFPIVQYHGSLEYVDEPSGVTEQRLKSAIDAGAVMAVAHHPHVAQGFEVYNNKLIAYSMGNFIFDQYFYVTPHSFVLYVWMDGEKFHRAEIVPIYIKGYKPTPAAGADRYTTLKRLKTLSEQRGVKLAVSGGHGIIQPSHLKSQNKSKKITKSLKNTTLLPLFDLPWESHISEISVSDTAKYRLGVSLTNGGNFENFSLFESNERGWLIDAANFNIVDENSNKVLALEKNSDTAWFGMQNFRRVYKPSTPMSLSLKIKSTKPASVKLYWQGRKTKQKFLEALSSGEKHLIGSFDYSPDGWKEIVADFNSPRIGYRSYRVLIELDGEAQTLLLDDVALVEWQTAFTAQRMPPRLNSHARQASFIGFDRPANGSLEMKVEH